MKSLAASFRSKREARRCYLHFDQTVCVSQVVHDDFVGILNFNKPCRVLYNTVESDTILMGAKGEAPGLLSDDKIRLIAVGTLKEIKGYDRMLRIIKRLRDEKYPVHLYILGIGPLQVQMEKYISTYALQPVVTLLGYQTNPYQYISKCDVFICASHAEGFSTAATEALIVGTPVCTVNVSGMKEMLGSNNEYGIVTVNDENSLYKGIKKLLDNPELLSYYKTKASERGTMFSTKETVDAVQNMLLNL